MTERFSPINKVKAARDKLANLKQDASVVNYNESYLKIIMDIPKISSDEIIDRYTRGLKRYIRTEICTKEYSSLNKAMSDALKVEAAKASFRWKVENQAVTLPTADTPTPMDISNVGHETKQREREKQRDEDMRNNECFCCHKVNCRIHSCPVRAAAKQKRSNVNNIPVVSLSSSGEEN